MSRNLISVKYKSGGRELGFPTWLRAMHTAGRARKQVRVFVAYSH